MGWSNLVSGSLTNVIASAVIAVIAFLAGTFRRDLVVRFRTRNTRKFWRPLRAQGLTLILGSEFSPFMQPGWVDPSRPIDTSALIDFEPFGLVGFGDAMAVIHLRDHLRVLDVDVEIAHSGDAADRLLSRNLVLVGGPDSNRYTAAAMKSLGVPLVFESQDDDRTRLKDLEAGNSYAAEFDSTTRENLRSDYGFVVRGNSPFSQREASVVLLAGIYGAGTLAAANVVTDSRTVSELVKFKRDKCLAILRTEVWGGNISPPQIVTARRFGIANRGS